MNNQTQVFRQAIRDLSSGLANWPLWSMLGWQDIRLRYRRSVIGPFWFTLSLGIWVAAIGTLYSHIMGIPLNIYIPYLALGLLAWEMISSLLIEGCTTFISSDRYIKQMGGVFSIFVYRLVWRNLIILLHNSAVYIVVAIIFKLAPNLNAFWVVPGLLVILINGIWVAILFGILSARYRDIPPIIQSVVRIFFFLTPIIWHAEYTNRPAFLAYNPFYHLVELIRTPLSGGVPSAESWYMVLGMTFVGCVLTMIVFSHTRNRIAYWT